jgi:hypothetical protein
MATDQLIARDIVIRQAAFDQIRDGSSEIWTPKKGPPAARALRTLPRSPPAYERNPR